MRNAIRLFLTSFRAGAAAVALVVLASTSYAQTITTIVFAIPQSDPVPYCEVLGYVTTLHPGPNQVNFELNLPMLGNGRFLFIGNGAFAGEGRGF